MKRVSILVAFFAVVFLVSCGIASGPSVPASSDPGSVVTGPGSDSPAVLTPRELDVEIDGDVRSIYSYLGEVVGVSEDEFRSVYTDKLNNRSAQAFTTNMTPDEIRQHIAAEVVNAVGIPDWCTIQWDGELLTCKCWAYDHAGVYHHYPDDLLGFIGIHGIFVTQYTDAEIDALADAMCWLGYCLPPDGPPTASPCE